MGHRRIELAGDSGQRAAKDRGQKAEDRRQRIDFDVLEFQWIVSRIELCISSPAVVAIVRRFA
jgi:hypothetical protein